MGDKHMPAGMKQIRAYVPIATAERLVKVAKALNVTVTDLGGQCVINGIDQAVQDRIMALEATLDELRRETGGGNRNGRDVTVSDILLEGHKPPPVRKGRAEKDAEVRREEKAEQLRMERGYRTRRPAPVGDMNRDQRTADDLRPKTRGTGR